VVCGLVVSSFLQFNTMIVLSTSKGNASMMRMVNIHEFSWFS